MRRSLFLIAIVILLCFVANGQQASIPEDGSVNDGVYSNTFFGFSVTYPKDWVVHGDATNTRLREISKERATNSGALSAASTEVILKNTYQLLTTFRFPMGAPDIEFNPSFTVVAENVSHAPAIVNGRDYFIGIRPLMIKLGVEPIHDEPTELVLSGRKFFRQDSRMQINGMSIQQAMIVSIIKGYALAFILSGKDQQTIDELAKALGTLKFVPSPSLAPKRP